MYECKYCGKDFERPNQIGGHTVMCSKNPNRRIQEQKFVEFNCAYCDKLVVKKKIKKNSSNRHFCDLTCSAIFNSTLDNNFNRKINERNFEFKIINSSNLEFNITNIEIEEFEKQRIFTIYIKKCEECRNVFKAKPTQLHNRFCCYKCSNEFSKKNIDSCRKGGKNSITLQNRRSKNEVSFANKCLEKFNNVGLNEKCFNGWDSDIILHDQKIAVLWNGVWHYKQIVKNHSIEQTQNRDRLKIKEIEKLGYIPYIIKDMGKYSEKKVQLEWDIFLNWLNEKNILVI
jgi:hypothetical protein